ncbi:GntR family transcriptional regulator [Streptosporangium sp. NPDC051022]|uniref:GntR family transcriptional regulator n=1 Tax=Streptosporangium sp. NPDC051022 TaxID=3155752 RepID=UPI0034464EF6
MTEPAYVRIAGHYARRIRTGDLRPGTQLPSYAEIAQQNSVSDIVVRKAIELLQSQGLVRSVRRRGNFVADRPTLARISPERQMESAETTFRNESDHDVQVQRDTARVPAGEDLAEVFGIAADDEVLHTVTRATEDGRPISISDTYQPLDIADISSAEFLEETLCDKLPTSAHAAWLNTTPGDLVKTVRQQFLTADRRTIMVSEIAYPRDRYDEYVFRMSLR